MEALIFFSLFFSSVFLRLEAVDIQYPFRSDFKLTCKDNKTVIRFPSYGELVVKSISYEKRRLDLLDPKNCVHEVFLNLNLSITPFRYFYDVRRYTYLNCSSELSRPLMEVPCLSGDGYHVYVVESVFGELGRCEIVKTVEIPFAYSQYLSDNGFGLRLMWGENGGEDVTEPGAVIGSESRDINVSMVLGITAFVFVGVAALIHVKIHRLKKPDAEKERENQNQLDIEKFLGDYETL